MCELLLLVIRKFTINRSYKYYRLWSSRFFSASLWVAGVCLRLLLWLNVSRSRVRSTQRAIGRRRSVDARDVERWFWEEEGVITQQVVMDSILPVILVGANEASIDHWLGFCDLLRNGRKQAVKGSLLARVLVENIALDFSVANVLALRTEASEPTKQFVLAGVTRSSTGTETGHLARGRRVGAIGCIDAWVSMRCWRRGLTHCWSGGVGVIESKSRMLWIWEIQFLESASQFQLMNHHNVTLHAIAPMSPVAFSWCAVDATIEIRSWNLTETRKQETLLTFANMNGTATFAIRNGSFCVSSSGDLLLQWLERLWRIICFEFVSLRELNIQYVDNCIANEITCKN